MEYDFKLDLNVENNSHTQLIRRIPPGSRVLELGCATGYMSDYLRRKRNCYVVCVELDRAMANKAKSACDRVIVGDVQKGHWLKSLADERFDIITCADILEHLREPIALLKILPGLLNEGGRLLATLPNGAHAALRLELLEGRFSYEETGLLDRTHLHLFTHHSLRELFTRGGFRVEELSYTFHDMADSEIKSRLQRLGLEARENGLALFHTPEAAAFQYIVSAVPDSEVTPDTFPPLTDKPMESSIEVYRVLHDELHQFRLTAAQHEAMIKERDRLLEEQHQRVMDLQREKVQTSAHIENLSNALKDSQKAFEEVRTNLDKTHTSLMEEVRLREYFEKLTQHSGFIEKELHQYKNRLENILNSRGWRGYMALMLPLRVYRRISPKLKAMLREPGLFKEWFQQVKQSRIESGTNDTDGQLAYSLPPDEEYARWIRDVESVGLPGKKSIELLNERSDKPLISIVMPVYNVDETWLRAAIDSVLDQTYDHWELCIADDASTKPHIKKVLNEYIQRYRRIKVVYREENGHIAVATNTALALATGDFVGLLDHDDELAPNALFFMASEILSYPDASLIYSDEDKLNDRGERFGHYFKADFNPDLMRAHNMICHFGVYRRSLVEKVGGIREGFDGAQDYDLALRCLRELDHHIEVRHITKVLYHWRAIPQSTASGSEAKSYAINAAIRAIEDDLNVRGIEADVMESELHEGVTRVRYRLPGTEPLVSIIIPTRNGESLLRQCIESIRNQTDYRSYQIIVVDNQSDDKKTIEYLDQLVGEANIQVLHYDHPFNFSAINNFAVEHAKGEIVCFMNDDIEVINADWLGEMVSHAIRPEIGAVGARLWYPDDRLQHGGVVLGIGGVAGHAMKYSRKGDKGYMGRSVVIQNYTAVTAACLLLRRAVFDAVSGFDSENLAVAFNDVDLCIRIHQQGYYNLWTPYAELYHHESASRGAEDTPEKKYRFRLEVEYMLEKYGPLLKRDPAYNPNLTHCHENFSLNWRGDLDGRD
ncbi:MAG: glycosyltransferase [Candidatus Thiodiazotropha sp. (ex. Lucinoma kazani)]